MRASVRLALLAGVALFAVGCGDTGPAEVPKNPVPMEKPGAGGNPQGGSPQGQQPVQPLK